MGDGIQAAKAGILEVADLFVVNKADRDGADQTVRDLRSMMGLAGRSGHSGDSSHSASAWRPPIVKTVASRGEGVSEVVTALERHRAWLEESGELARRRLRRASDEVEAIALTALRARMGHLRDGARLDELASQVVAGKLDPYAAADQLAAGLAASPAGRAAEFKSW
jgi:LAO/AO transport system kinase